MYAFCESDKDRDGEQMNCQKKNDTRVTEDQKSMSSYSDSGKISTKTLWAT